MNEQGFRRILEDIAAKEIPDTMDVWQAILSQPDKPKRKRKPRSTFRWIAGIAAVLVLVITGGIIIALNNGSQEVVPLFYGGDSGIVQAGTAGLITDLQIIHKHPTEDINITLVWAYADGNRIEISYQVDYASNLDIPTVVTAKLFDKHGKSFVRPDYIRGGGGGGGGGSDREMFGGNANFDARHITDNPDRLALRLVLDFAYADAQGSGGGGGEGGGGSSDEWQPTPVVRIPVVPFSIDFDFSLPFIPAVRIQDTSTVTQSGVRMAVSDVIYAPSVTLANLCFTSLDDRLWTPAIDMSGDFQAAGLDFIRAEQSHSDGQTCGQMVFMGMLRPIEGKLNIQVDEIASDFIVTDTRMNEFAADMRSRGFELIMYQGETDNSLRNREMGFWYGQFGFTLTKIPLDQEQDGSYYDTVTTLVDNHLVDRVQGPWIFTFDLS